MGRVYNFSAGPACMQEVPERGHGGDAWIIRHQAQSVMEMSPAPPPFEDLHDAENSSLPPGDIRMTTGCCFCRAASTQFAMVPLNLTKQADYLLTGTWAKRRPEARRPPM